MPWPKARRAGLDLCDHFRYVSRANGITIATTVLISQFEDVNGMAQRWFPRAAARQAAMIALSPASGYAVAHALIWGWFLAWTALPAAAADYCVSCSGPEAHYRCTFDGDTATERDPGLQLYCISALAREGGHESCSIERRSASPCPGTHKILALPGDYEPVPHAGNDVAPPSGTSQAKVPQAGEAAGADGPDGSITPAATEKSDADQAPSGSAMPQAPRAAAPGANADVEAQSAPQPKDGKAAWSNTSGAPQGQPKTVEDIVKSESANTAKSIETAGGAVGDAAKSTGTAIEKAGSAVGDAAKKTWKCLTSLFGDC
ncbi:MAG: hypothetical protein ABL907_07740 [Hyphomicrobium sp.]